MFQSWQEENPGKSLRKFAKPSVTELPGWLDAHIPNIEKNYPGFFEQWKQAVKHGNALRPVRIQLRDRWVPSRCQHKIIGHDHPAPRAGTDGFTQCVKCRERSPVRRSGDIHFETVQNFVQLKADEIAVMSIVVIGNAGTRAVGQ